MNNRGFTLIELLIVIAIIGTLSAMMFPNFLSAQDKAKEVAVKTIVLSTQNALENYSIDNGSYPTGSQISVSELAQALLIGGYLSASPKNPFTGRTYASGDTQGRIVYSYDSTAGQYQLTAYKRDGVTVLIEVSNI